MRAARRRVIVAAGDAAKTEVTNQLDHLVRLLADGRWAVEVALVGDGERLQALRAVAPVLVADHYRTRGLGGIASALGLRRLAGRYKSWRVRRWAAGAVDAAWIIVDPRACSFVRHAPHAPSILVGAWLTPGAHPQDLAPVDRAVLDGAVLWLAAGQDQAAELEAAFDAPVRRVGDLYEPPRQHLPHEATERDPIVVSSRGGLWREISHAVEIVAGLQERRPDVPIAWLADAGEDAWLARHDLAHLGLGADAPVRVVVRDSPIPPVRPLLLVRTSYAATDPDLAVAAALEGIPTLGFDLGDLPEAAGDPAPPFGVEVLLDQVIGLLDDDRRARVGAALQREIERRHDVRQRLAPLYDLLDDPMGR